MELLRRSTRGTLAQHFLQVGIHTVDGRLVPALVLRIVGRIVRVDLRHGTRVTGTLAALVALLVAAVPLPREVERTPTTILRTSGVPLQHDIRSEVVPFTPVVTFIKLLHPDGLGSPCRSRIPQRGERLVQSVRAAVQNLLEALLSQFVAVLSLGGILLLAVGTVGQTVSLPHVGIAQIGQGHTLCGASVFLIHRFPVEQVGSSLEVFDDEVPHLAVGLSLSLCGRVRVGFTGSQHGHAAEGCCQPVIEESAQRTAFTLEFLLHGRRHLFGIAQAFQIVVGTADAGIDVAPASQQLGAGGVPLLHIPVLIPARSLGIDGRVATCEEVGLEAPVAVVEVLIGGILGTIREHHVVDAVQTLLGIGVVLEHGITGNDVIEVYIQELVVVAGCEAQTRHAQCCT